MIEDEIDKFGRHVLEALFEKAEPLISAGLAKRGVSSPSDLPREEAWEILISAVRQTALLHFPDMDIAKLERGFRIFSDPAFSDAHAVLRDTPIPTDAFQPALGEQAAILMAGVGLPVAAVDLEDLFGPIVYSNDLKLVSERFKASPHAIVGYCTARAEFYSLSTDCVRTLRYRAKYTKEGRPIGALLRRHGVKLPTTDERFVHFSIALGRRAGDQIPTINIFDDREDRGSIMLLAGWVDASDRVRGAPRDGLAPVPLSIVRLAVQNPKFAYWLTEPHDTYPVSIH